MRLYKIVLRFAFVAWLALLLPGCVPPSSDRGVKLSQAMKASATGSQNDVGGGQTYRPDDGDDGDVLIGLSDFCGASYDKQEFPYQLLADVSYQRVLNGPMNSLTHFTLTPVAVENENTFLGAYIGGGTVDLKSGSLANLAIQDIWTLDAGLTYRRYLGPSWTAFCPYVGCSLGGSLLFWHYRHPVLAGGGTISSDDLPGAEGSVMVGFSTQRDRRLSAFAEAGVGGTVFYGTTTQGFQNDVFSDFGCLIVKTGVCLKF